MRPFEWSCVVAAVLSIASVGRADDNKAFTLSRETSASAPAGRARALAAKGNCADALDAFDEALRHSLDPVLYRDRGLCHDQLGHHFPAIDDYRVYLTNVPNAPDAEKIRARLDDLESKTPADERLLGGGGNYELEMRGGVGSYHHTTPSKSEEQETKVNANDTRSLSEIESTERRDREANSSPLRDGKGPVIGFFALARGFANDKSTFGVTQSYGLALRYSFSAISTVISEIAYVNAQSTGTASQLGGIGIFVGYEARISLDHWSSNHLILGAGLGYENLKQGSTGFVYSTFLPRARVGWRHTFSRAIGLEFTGDGGVALTHSLGSTADDLVSEALGGSVAFLVGF